MTDIDFLFEALVKSGFAKVEDDGEIAIFIGKNPGVIEDAD